MPETAAEKAEAQAQSDADAKAWRKKKADEEAAAKKKADEEAAAKAVASLKELISQRKLKGRIKMKNGKVRIVFFIFKMNKKHRPFFFYQIIKIF